MKAHKDIIGQFPANLIFPSRFYMVTVNADNYAQTAERLYLLGIYNTADSSDGESEKCRRLSQRILSPTWGTNINVTGIQLIYADKNGMYDIEIRADTFQPLNTNRCWRLLKNARKKNCRKTI